MSVNRTEKLGLHTWLENEIVDFEEMNENFEIMDALPLCIGSGARSAPYSGSTLTTDAAVWYFRRYSDGVVEISGKFVHNALPVSTGAAAPYTTDQTTITFPITFNKIYSINITCNGYETMCIPVLTTPADITNYISYKLMSFTQETSSEYTDKEVYITVKGEMQDGNSNN